MAKKPAVKSREEMVEAALVAEEQTEEETLTLANGTIVRPRQLPETIMRRVFEANPEPDVPIISKEIGGKTVTEENPGSPSYQEALAEHRANVAEATFGIVMLRGVEILEQGPECYPVKDPEWVMELEFYGLKVPKKGPVRRMMWMESQVITTGEDLFAVQEACLALSGVTEQAVALASQRFQRPVPGQADPEDTDETLGTDVEPGVRGEAGS